MKTVTFHKHEVFGSQICRKSLNDFGFNPETVEKASTLVLLHQVRFYPNTKQSTYRKFLKKLGKVSLEQLKAVLLSDRAGNSKKKEFPLITREFQKVERILMKMTEETIYPVMSFENIRSLGFNEMVSKQIMSNIQGIVNSSPHRNTKKYLLDYIFRNYGTQVK